MDVFDQPVSVERCTLQPRISSTNLVHSEDWHELHYIVHGSGRLEWTAASGHGHAALSAGDAIHHPPGTDHRMAIIGTGFVLQYIVWFAVRDPAWLRAVHRRWPPLRVRPCGTGHRRSFHDWQEALIDGGAWRRRATDAGFCAWFYQQLSGPNPSRLPAPVQAMVELLQERCTDPPSGDELAETAGCSAPHANRLFRRHLGVPPRRYAMDLRLRMAADLLRSDDAAVKAVAERLGFDDPYHFSRVFTKWAGVNPTEWRR